MNKLKEITEKDYDLIMRKSENTCKDILFLNKLWQYVQRSKPGLRMPPKCAYCATNEGVFSFEGFGAMHPVAHNIMFIPDDSGNVYKTEDIVFHIFFMHDVQPTDFFRDLVMKAPDTQSEEYIAILREYFYSDEEKKILSETASKTCECCGQKYSGTFLYQKGSTELSVKACEKDSFWDKTPIRIKKKCAILCDNCFHENEVKI